MRESTIETAVCKYAKGKGWIVYKFTSPGNRSVPDRLFIRNKVVFFIEFKTLGKKPTKLQAKTIEDIKSQGICAYVCDNIKHGKFLIDLYDNA